jgi:hypothetical protein
MSHWDWGTVPQWIGAFLQATTAGIAVYIAWRAHVFTRTSNHLTFYKYLTDLANDWNKIVIASPKTVGATGRLRPPVIDYPTDSIVHIYLNYHRFAYLCAKDGLVDNKSSEARINNSIKWFSNVTREQLEDYLSRGYEEEFRTLMFGKYDNMKHNMKRGLTF